MSRAAHNPIAFGTLLAVLAAVAFGIATPFIQRFGAAAGPFATAFLLYVGAALGSLAWTLRGSHSEARVRRVHLARLACVALLGAALAPTLFAWGLQRTAASTASLLLNLEALFTLALAAGIRREHIGRRVGFAATLMFVGGAIAVAGTATDGPLGVLGSAAVIGAVLCWALDNVLSRPLADLNPAAVVMGKASIGAALTGAIAVVRAEPVPDLGAMLGLLACGATGYGVSLHLYLMAQRRIGAGRTGSVFAVAPFLGVIAAVAMGDHAAGGATLVAGTFFAVAVALHLSEQHAHRHAHEALEHEHAHRHDDAHHDHVHEPPVTGVHSHPHHHDAHTHAHPHGPDLHHGHHH